MTNHYPIDREPINTIIDGKIVFIEDAWRDGADHYYLGCCLDDTSFYMVEVNKGLSGGHMIKEYDHKPTRYEVVNDYVDYIAARAIDDYEAEFGADAFFSRKKD